MTFQIIDPSFGVNAMGGSSYGPGLPLLPSSSGLTELEAPMFCLGAFDAGLAGFDAVEGLLKFEPRTQQLRAVLVAALQPGTPVAGRTAKALASKAMQLATLADNRAKVTQDARRGYQRAMQETVHFDQQTELARRNGLFEEARAFRARAIAAGRRAVRYQKVNALATGMTQNAIAQSHLATKLAGAVLAGRPDLAAMYGVTYDKLGASSEYIRSIRAMQLAKHQQGLQGFGDLDQIFEGELNELEELNGWLSRRIKKGFKKLGRKIDKKVLKPIAHVAVKAAKKIGKVAAIITLGLPCKLAKTKAWGAVLKTTGSAIGQIYGGPAGGAVGGRIGERAHDTDGAMCGALDKIGLTKGKFHKGSVRSALREAAIHIGKKAIDPKEAMKTFSAVGGSLMSGGSSNILGGSGGDIVKSLLGKVTGGGNSGALVNGLIGKISGQGGAGAQKLLSSLVRGKGGAGIDLLATYAKGGGGDLLNVGQQAFKKFGLEHLQGQFLDRMKHVAADQIGAQLSKAAKTANISQASNLLKGATRDNAARYVGSFATQAFSA
jgi:hypothetical protein